MEGKTQSNNQDGGPGKIINTTGPFVTYEPACKRKLGFFPDQECLLDALGHEGQKIQDWMPEDRAIDCAGRAYCMVYRSQDDFYDIEPTGEIWDYPRLLEIAIEDTIFIKRDPEILRERVDRVPDPEKFRVIMEYIDELPSIPFWGLCYLIIFLILFGLAVTYGAYHLIIWLTK